MSNDPEHGYFADGMVEEITTALSRNRWLFVIARNVAFAALLQKRAGAVVIAADAFFNSHVELLAALAIRDHEPAIYEFRSSRLPEGRSATAAVFYRQADIYTGRALKGEKPGDRPVQQSTKAELIINLKTAKALGVLVPLSLLCRADEVIE